MRNGGKPQFNQNPPCFKIWYREDIETQNSSLLMVDSIHFHSVKYFLHYISNNGMSELSLLCPGLLWMFHSLLQPNFSTLQRGVLPVKLQRICHVAEGQIKYCKWVRASFLFPDSFTKYSRALLMHPSMPSAQDTMVSKTDAGYCLGGKADTH